MTNMIQRWISPLLYDNETPKDSVITSQKALNKAGRRPLPRNPMAIAQSVAASVARSVASSSLHVTGQCGYPSFSKTEMKRISTIEKNWRQRPRRKAEETAALVRNRSAPKDVTPGAPPISGEIIAEGRGATLRYSPENRSVLLSLGDSSTGGRTSDNLHKKSQRRRIKDTSLSFLCGSGFLFISVSIVHSLFSFCYQVKIYFKISLSGAFCILFCISGTTCCWKLKLSKNPPILK